MKVLLAITSLALLAAAAPAHADQVSAIQAVRSQPRVLDVKADAGGVLYVMVKADNKVAWDQFATYLCQVVKPHRARIFKTRIIEVTKANFSQNPNNWPRLGESTCAQ